MYQASPEHLGHNRKLRLHNRVMRKPPPKPGGNKKNSPHKWLRVRKQMEKEKVLNAALIK
jgi:hypothetical protein